MTIGDRFLGVRRLGHQITRRRGETKEARGGEARGVTGEGREEVRRRRRRRRKERSGRGKKKQNLQPRVEEQVFAGVTTMDVGAEFE